MHNSREKNRKCAGKNVDNVNLFLANSADSWYNIGITAKERRAKRIA